MEHIPVSTLMIELDVLLDTRLAVLAQLEDVVLERVLTSGYHTRYEDCFPSVEDEWFKAQYKARNKSILADAMITPIGLLAKEFCIKTLEMVVTSPFHMQPKILLNIYPYDLTANEIDVLMRSMIDVTNGLADVEIISLSTAELTPRYVKQHCAVMVMYDYAHWLEYHSLTEAFKTTTCPEVGLLAPAIYFKPIEASKVNVNAFKSMEELARPLIGLTLMPIEHFSIVVKPKTA